MKRLFFGFLVVAAVLCGGARAAVVYVNQAVGSSGDGTTWGTAKKTLAEGLTMADGVTYTEIWVAQGTYKPGTLTTDKFTLKNNVALYGGFTSGMANLTDRNWVTHPTILSGDINGDDQPNWVNRTDNSVNILYAGSGVANAVVDGFTVSGAYNTAAGAYPGGGFACNGATSFRIANCVFTENRVGTSTFGAAIGINNATPACAAAITNCLIYGNWTPYRGGGIGIDGYNYVHSLTVQNCTIVTNWAASSGGGGVYTRALAANKVCTMNNCIIRGNWGGADLKSQTGTKDVINYCDYGTVSGTYVYTGVNKQLDPLFVSGYPTYDFHLTASSPCKDAGTATGAPALDYDGVTRDATPDMGAYEFVSGGDTTPPGEVSGVSVTPGHQFLTLGWTNPGDSDFSGVLVLRKLGSAPTGTPTVGVTYSVGNTIGDGTVAYVNNGTGFTDSGLVNGSTYYYKLCTYDTLKNYSTGTGTSGTPVADTTPPDPVSGLTVAAQSDTAIKLDWVNSSSSDAQGVLILRKTGGVPTGSPVDNTVYTAGNTIGDGTVIYVGTGSVGTPGVASTWTDSSLTLELTTYGYSVFARDIVPNYSTRSDGSAATLTDNTAPGNVTAQTATGDDGAVALGWTNPSDLDVAGVVILRSTAGTPDGTLANGTTYTVGTVLGNGTVVYASSSATPSGAGTWSDQPLANGTPYYYKIFARDEHPNYASGGAACNATPAAPSSIKYVDGSAAAEGNGSMWGNAFKTLTNALANASSGDELWVAEGTYKPGTRTNDYFNLKSDVKLYGGFASGMTHRYERDWNAHPTVLSGDLNGDDQPNWVNRTDNSVTVLYAGSGVANLVVDGFTVRGAYSTLAGDTSHGGGGFIGAGVTTFRIANCVFTDNRVGPSTYGGAIGFNNVAPSGTAVGTIENCLIYGNYSPYRGGGVAIDGYNAQHAITLQNCTIVANYAGTDGGGGVYVRAFTTKVCTMNNCIIRGNTGAGADLYTRTGTQDVINYCDYGTAGGTASFTFTGVNQQSDPLFVSASSPYDLHLTSSSPCKDAGTSSSAPSADLDGVSRPQFSGFDIGAYEYVTPATVTINQAAGQADPANGTINFTVVFSEAVGDFAAGDVTLSGTAGATTAVVTGSGTTYNVAVSGMTGDGTVTASIPAYRARAISSSAPNAASTSTDNTVTYDATPPSVTINQAIGQADPTSGATINFTVVFSESVSDFATGDVTLGGTAGATTAVVTGGGTTYNVAVSGMTGDGTVIASIAVGQAHDAASNPNAASTSTDNTVTYDATPPIVTINQAIGQADPTSGATINFTVVFSESVSDFATGDVTLGGTAGATTADVTGGGTTYNVAVSGMTGDGTVIASIAAGKAHDATGNASDASTSTDNAVTYDATPPSVTINQAGGQADPASGSPINFTVVFSEAVSDFATGDVTLGGTAGATTAVVTGSGTTYNVAVSGMTGNGTVTASIDAGQAHDAASNPNAASTSTDNDVTYNQPTSLPAVTVIRFK